MRRRLQRLAAVAAATLVCLVLPGGAVGPSTAAPGDPADPAAEVAGGNPILLVLDTSGSMGEDDGTGTIKIEGAKNALLNLLARLPLDTHIGMRTYPAASGGCDSGSIDIGLARRDPGDMSASIRAVTADGDTPTAEALAAAAEDIKSRGYSQGTIVLVSDGEHTCDDPCEVARSIRDQGIGLTVDTVGFRIDDAGAQELQCISGATGGTYTPVDDSAALGDRLAALQAPRLELDAPDVPSFSPLSEGVLGMTATVRNTSGVDARNVRLALTYHPSSSGGAPTVLTPLRLLGNLEAGGSRTVRWSVYPSTQRASGQLDWTVTLTAIGVPVQARAGVTTLSSEFRLDTVGPVFQDVDDVVILGDSYSSGEGGGDYGPGGACHRSPNAWGRQAFPKTVAVHNLACSGAVVADYWASDQQKWLNPWDDVESQHDQLDALKRSGDVDVVALTMGGNDIQFPDLVKSCVTTANCVDNAVCDDQGSCLTWREHMELLLAGLGPQLRLFYEDVARVAGTDVVVLPYPDLLPNTSRGRFTCTAGLPGFSPDEQTFGRWVQDELHRQISAAVRDVAAKGLPVHLARDVRTALQPNHTICDRDPWVVQVTDRDILSPERVHPDPDGYRAMAGALVRWSASPAAPQKATRGKGETSSLLVRTAEGLGQLLAPAPIPVDTSQPGNTLQARPGVPLQITSGGHLQGSLVVVGVQSTPQALGSAWADADGRVTVDVQLPENLPDGEHTLWTSGLDPDGQLSIDTQQLDVGGSAPWWPTAALSLTCLLLAASGWLLLRVDRRRTRRRAPA
ncbi:GDSL-type esterase/lipase family protein [Blastococcus sp. CT_GayMR16]|uniref:GDSL-type esterase/lipase family protein n=1 Tax=Blastococcus sp. CT_GayMR16 TaxID=2559607 RepID=UPI0010740EBC|nr:GDSL-type esterase/lipase family protein [Blastococcus sp. CT_GayMR16]TFV87163.1 VWA domain-containing protein [Blastococcus sp. CT_GayMR16]